MEVTIKEFNVQMEVKNKGIEFEIKSPKDSSHMGDLIITKTQLIWCPGRTGRDKGKKVKLEKFIDWMHQQE